MEKLNLATIFSKIVAYLKEVKVGNKDKNTTIAGLVALVAAALSMFGIDMNADVFDLIKTYVPALKDGLPLNKVIIALCGFIVAWYTGKKEEVKA